MAAALIVGVREYRYSKPYNEIGRRSTKNPPGRMKYPG
jgi:hypothetical protein